MLLPTAASSAAPGDARATADQLVDDTRALARTPSLSARARAIRTAAVGDPCRALRLVASYRRGLRSVPAQGQPPAGSPSGPASPRGTLTADALAVDAALRQLRKTARCGGGADGATRSLAVRTTRSGAKTLKLRIALPAARLVAQGGGGRDFVELRMDGAASFGKPGAPGVPGFTPRFAVPRGADVDVAVSGVQGYTLRGVDLMPEQRAATDAVGVPDPPFVIDRRAYRRAGGFPGRVANAVPLGTMRDLTVGGVRVAGLRYDPVERTARVITSIDVTVTFRGGGDWRPKHARRAPAEPGWERIYRSTVANYGDTSPGPRLRGAGVLPCGEQYLIVTSPALRTAADTLAAAKQAAGLQTAIFDTAEIGTTAEEIRTFIRSHLNSADCMRPSYVALLGDPTHVPTFNEPCYSGTSSLCGEQVATDLSYSLDGVSNDLFADVMLGRIPANTLVQANTAVNKIVAYQTEAPAPPGDDFYNHATVTSFFEGLGPQDARGYSLSSERFRAGLRSRGHIVHRLYNANASADIQKFRDGTPIPNEIKPPNFLWDADGTDFLNEINAGRFLVLHRDHGWEHGFANPTLHTGHVPQMTNGTELPVVFAVNCLSGNFSTTGDAPSMGEQMLHRAGGGAVAVFGDTGVSPTGQNDTLAVGFADAMFPQTVPTNGASEPLRRLGEILLAGKSYMYAQHPQPNGNSNFEMQLWHLLGDPHMEIRSAEPQQFQPTTKFEHRTDSFPTGAPAFRVRVTTTQPDAEGATATLKRGTATIGQATVSGGVALITPWIRTDSAQLSVTLADDGFETKSFPVAAPVPSLTAQCPGGVWVPPGGTATVVSGTLSPTMRDALVKLRITRPNGAWYLTSALTNSSSQWSVAIPIAGNERGTFRVEAFFDGEGKYGVDDATCYFTAVG